jgi:hypothetical protein
MLKIFYITAVTMLMAAGIFVVACTKDPGMSLTAAPHEQNIINTAVADCNEPGGSYAEKKLREVVSWGGRYGNRYSKTTDISIHNTGNELKLLVKSTKYIADVHLLFPDEEQPRSLKSSQSFFHRSLEQSFPLPSHWQMNDTIYFELLVSGPGPEAIFKVDYVLRENCN